MLRFITISLMMVMSISVFAQGKISRSSQKSKASKVTNVTTSCVSGKINGHDYVDLGLPSGLKWATCNVGATKPAYSGEDHPAIPVITTQFFKHGQTLCA